MAFDGGLALSRSGSGVDVSGNNGGKGNGCGSGASNGGSGCNASLVFVRERINESKPCERSWPGGELLEAAAPSLHE